MPGILNRKDQHLDVILSGAAAHGLAGGFDAVRFVHEALPDLDHAGSDSAVAVIGIRLKARLFPCLQSGGVCRA